ncbi:MAG: hypothetical protein JW936_07405 [Sedimentisphaerales bacterium]|nr:hypothetical protein [Sedimentisphaerales bacterium]
MSIIEKSGRGTAKREMTYEQVSSQPTVMLRSWTDAACDQTLIGQLQHALEGRTVLRWEDLDMAIRVRLRVVAQRLQKVRRFGGMYAELSLSPQLEAIFSLMPTPENTEHEMLIN